VAAVRPGVKKKIARPIDWFGAPRFPNVRKSPRHKIRKRRGQKTLPPVVQRPDEKLLGHGAGTQEEGNLEGGVQKGGKKIV